jgi:protein ImuB
MVDAVAANAGVECQIGIADGLFAATLAARRGVVVPQGETPAFLAPLRITELRDLQLGHLRLGGAHLDSAGFTTTRARLSNDGTDTNAPGNPELVDLLHRLGIRTLGAFAALPERDVASRFGGAAVLAHRLASGRFDRHLARRQPPPDLEIISLLDPPADRIDTVAFAAKVAAQQLHTNLVANGMVCTRLTIQAETATGQQRERTWRCAEPLSLSGIADRVRWQLDGWLRATGDDRPNAAITVLRLIPSEVIDGTTLQFGLWAGAGLHDAVTPEDEKAARAFVHVQGLLGQEGVYTAVLGGGRGPGEQVQLVPWGEQRSPATDPVATWPGRLPEPAPSIVPVDMLPAALLDEEGAEVGVTGRLLLTGVPRAVSVSGGPSRAVLGWAGPWPVVEWWEAEETRAVRLQVTVADRPQGAAQTQGQSALLLVRTNGRWLVEGIYD